jgi:hypothetical protein
MMRTRPGYLVFSGLFVLASYCAFQARIEWLFGLCILSTLYLVMMAIVDPKIEP